MLAQHSLHRRLVVAVSLATLIFSTVVGFLSFFYGYHSQRERSRRLIDQLVATVRSSAAVAAFTGNQPIAAEVIEGLLANPIIAGVHIETYNGNVFGRDREAALDGQDTPKMGYPLFSPVDPQHRIGSLLVHQDRGEINRMAKASALYHALPMLLHIPLSAGILVLIFGRLVGRPLDRISRLIEAVPPGSDRRIEMPAGHANNEIGMLVNSTNALLTATQQAIAEERRLRAEVDALQAHYRRIFETTSVGVMIIRSDGTLLNCNPTLGSRIIDLPKEVMAQGNFINSVFKHPEKAWALVQQAWETGHPAAADLQLQTATDHDRWVHAMLSVSLDAYGDIEYIEGVLYDITARRIKETEIRRAAELDQLTGLYNRRGIELFLDRALVKASSNKACVGIMLLDLDGFKAVNDTHGHAAGDVVLRVVGERLRSKIRKAEDAAARLGGDEFLVIVLTTCETNHLLLRIAEDMLHAIGEPIAVGDGVDVQVGASIGIACFPQDGHGREQLLLAADAAMYQVKRSGKNGFALAESTEPASPA